MIEKKPEKPQKILKSIKDLEKVMKLMQDNRVNSVDIDNVNISMSTFKSDLVDLKRSSERDDEDLMYLSS